MEDCYAGPVWTHAHATELGGDPDQILIVGASAGGGLAAGVALMARDRQGPPLIGQVLMCPMIDDRNETPSSHELDEEGVGTARRTTPVGTPSSATAARPTS